MSKTPTLIFPSAENPCSRERKKSTRCTEVISSLSLFIMDFGFTIPKCVGLIIAPFSLAYSCASFTPAIISFRVSLTNSFNSIIFSSRLLVIVGQVSIFIPINFSINCQRINKVSFLHLHYTFAHHPKTVRIGL